MGAGEGADGGGKGGEHSVRATLGDSSAFHVLT